LTVAARDLKHWLCMFAPFPLRTPPPVRPPLRVIADLLQLVEEAKRDKSSIPLADAFDGRAARRWRELEAEMRRLLAEQPS
jgi:hypothetical protein